MSLTKVELEDLLNATFEYMKTKWQDGVDDPEGDNSSEATPFAAILANNFENGIKLAHDRLNDTTTYLEDSDRTQKNLRFEFLLLKASVTSGLTSNILVENFETANKIVLDGGMHDPELQRIYLP